MLLIFDSIVLKRVLATEVTLGEFVLILTTEGFVGYSGGNSTKSSIFIDETVDLNRPVKYLMPGVVSI